MRNWAHSAAAKINQQQIFMGACPIAPTGFWPWGSHPIAPLESVPMPSCDYFILLLWDLSHRADTEISLGSCATETGMESCHKGNNAGTSLDRVSGTV